MTKESVRPYLDSLAALAGPLNQTADEATKELREVEAELLVTGIGLEVELEDTLEHGPSTVRFANGSPSTTEVSHLAFARQRGGEWRILVRTYEESRSVEDTAKHSPEHRVLIRETPVLEASRELRIAAAEQVENLLRCIENAAKRRIAAGGRADAFEADWSHSVKGADASGLVHVLSLSTAASLCGARIQTGHFAEYGRNCPKCEALLRDSRRKEAEATLRATRQRDDLHHRLERWMSRGAEGMASWLLGFARRLRDAA